MQTDMHYHATYCMARAAGLRREAARMIATACEFVDDCIEEVEFRSREGIPFSIPATAHHAGSIANIGARAQREVWVPFHFLPGCRGKGVERWLCAMNGPLAQAVMRHHCAMLLREHAKEPWRLALVGIGAHAFMDTFAHYDFFGFSTRLNEVDQASIRLMTLQDPDMAEHVRVQGEEFVRRYGREMGSNVPQGTRPWWRRAWDTLAGETAETLSGALGHGAVLTYPDRPYLKWHFRFEGEEEYRTRDNPQTFLHACLELHAYFSGIYREHPALRDTEIRHKPDWFRDGLNDHVQGILAGQTHKARRCELWDEVAQNGDFFSPGEPIPLYDGERWLDMIEGFKRRLLPAESIVNKEVYAFAKAARFHRHRLLEELIPLKMGEF